MFITHRLHWLLWTDGLALDIVGRQLCSLLTPSHVICVLCFAPHPLPSHSEETACYWPSGIPRTCWWNERWRTDRQKEICDGGRTFCRLLSLFFCVCRRSSTKMRTGTSSGALKYVCLLVIGQPLQNSAAKHQLLKRSGIKVIKGNLWRALSFSTRAISQDRPRGKSNLASECATDNIEFD